MFKGTFRRVGKDKLLTDLGVRDFADISRRLQNCVRMVEAELNVEFIPACRD